MIYFNHFFFLQLCAGCAVTVRVRTPTRCFTVRNATTLCIRPATVSRPSLRATGCARHAFWDSQESPVFSAQTMSSVTLFILLMFILFYFIFILFYFILFYFIFILFLFHFNFILFYFIYFIYFIFFYFIFDF